ncbi:MAG: glutamyl-tRNA reductase [Natronomonas sp.]|jgi:glutamyl-tRNA reductase
MTERQSPQYDVERGCAAPPIDIGESRDQAAEPSEGGVAGDAERAVPRSLRRVTCVSVTHRTHSAEQVGELAPTDPLDVARTIHEADRVTEAMVLSTCNRLEVYLSTRRPVPEDREAALEATTDALALPSDARTYVGRDVAVHLARVTAGIESAVLGEDEIAGQVSDTLTAAKEAGLTAGVLGRIGNAALRAGRKCRTETDIGEGTTGYGSAVCRAITDELDEAPDRVLLVGGGEMARTVSRAIRRRWDARIDVANRSPARDLPTEDGTWWSLAELSAAVGDVDAVVTATGADHRVFDASHADRCDGTVPVVDLATPPDVSADARDHPAVAVTDLDDLAAGMRSARDRRRTAVADAEAVIADVVDRLVENERENRAEDVIRELHREAAGVRATELDRAKRRLAESDVDSEEVLEDFANALVGRLLGPPTDELRTAARERDETALRAARRLFDLDGDEKT